MTVKNYMDYNLLAEMYNLFIDNPNKEYEAYELYDALNRYHYDVYARRAITRLIYLGKVTVHLNGKVQLAKGVEHEQAI